MSSLLDPLDNAGPINTAESIAAEQNLLGTLMMFPGRLAAARDMLRPDDFVHPLHAEIYATLIERDDLGEIVSPAALAGRMGNREIEGNHTLKEYLAHIVTQHASPQNSVPAQARTVRDAAGLRRLHEIVTSLNDYLRTGGIKDPVPLANQLMSEVEEIIASELTDSTKPMSLGDAAKRALEASLQAQRNKTPPGISTSIPALDAMLRGGMQNGQLIVLAGRPGMGKSAAALTVGLGASRRDVATMFASLEMVAEDIGERVLSAQAYTMGHEIPYERISAGEIDDEEAMILVEAQRELDTLPFQLDTRSGLTLAQIASSARRYFARQRETGRTRGLLVVDYLGLVKSSDRYRSQRVHEIGEVTRGLKALAKELGVPVLLLCQLSRQVEHRDDKKPILSDLRDSGEIEQDADTVLFVYREEYYLNQIDPSGLTGDDYVDHMQRLNRASGVLEIGVAKQRKGKTGWVRNYCHIGCNIISELRGQ